MTNFHDNPLWQKSYVALMDIHDVVESTNPTAAGGQIVEDLLDAARNVAAKISDGLSRLDRRFGRQLVQDAIGLVAITRTQLAVAWGRGLFPDETFKALDDKYAELSEALQNYK